MLGRGQGTSLCCDRWIGKTGHEFFTGSSDGYIKWWDIRCTCSQGLGWSLLVSCRRNFSTPVRQYCMESGFSKNKDFPPGINSLSFEPTIPSKFMVGTEQGGVIICRSAV